MNAAALPAPQASLPPHALAPPVAQPPSAAGWPATRSPQTQQPGLQPVAPAAPTEPAAPATVMDGIQEHPKWTLLAKLPTRLNAAIPLPHFKVKDLLALKQGQLIKSQWESTADVLLKAGGVPFSWSEFEVVEERMAVRITRLA